MTSKQQRHRQGFASDEMVVPAEAKRVEYPVFVPEWMETTKTSRMILNGAVKVADPKGNVRTLLQKMDLRFGVLPEGALMKLSHIPHEYQASIGGEVPIPLTIYLVADFREPVTIELVPNEDQMGLIAAEPLTLDSGETECTLAVKLQDDIKLIGEQPFLLRATEYIQRAFGWWNYHLHQFEIAGKRYMEPDPDGDDWGMEFEDERNVRISKLLPKSGERTRWIYEYDFGDSWRHEVLFEDFLPPDPKAKYPLCLEGARACPPEDCGGPWGYGDYLEAISNPRHEAHKEMLRWRGPFDPEAFDVKKATKEMKKVKT